MFEGILRVFPYLCARYAARRVRQLRRPMSCRQTRLSDAVSAAYGFVTDHHVIVDTVQFFKQPVEAVTLKHRNSQFVRANTWAVVKCTEDHKTQLFGYKQMSVRFVQYAFCSLYFNYNIYGYIINK